MKKTKKTWKQRLWSEIKGAIIGSIIAITGIYLITSTLYTQKVTFSNGERQIVFQGMVHYADKPFFDTVNKTVKEYKDKDYTHYYEGVTGLNNEKFEQVTGVPNVLELWGVNLESQYNHFETGKNDIRADVDVSDIEKITNAPDSIIFDKEQLWENTKPRIMIFGIKISVWTDNSIMYYWDKKLYKAVIKMRDKHLVETVLKGDKNAIITYGQAHLNGVEKHLKNEGYKIIDRDYVLAIGY